MAVFCRPCTPFLIFRASVGEENFSLPQSAEFAEFVRKEDGVHFTAFLTSLVSGDLQKPLMSCVASQENGGTWPFSEKRHMRI